MNAINLKNPMTKWGWTVRTVDDMVLALEGDSYFSTVATCFIREAVLSSLYDRHEWDSVEQMGSYIKRNYI